MRPTHPGGSPDGRCPHAGSRPWIVRRSERDKNDAELVPIPMHLGAVEAERDAQGTSSRCTFEVGFSPRILQQITTSPVETILRELPHGSSKAMSIRNGQRWALSFGFVVNVRISPTRLSSHTLIALWPMIAQRGQGRVCCGT